jgi:hypothetical protein
MKARDITVIIDRKRYSTQKATLIASDAYWNGRNWERRGSNAFLYRTDKGNYFLVVQAQEGSIERASHQYHEAIVVRRGTMLDWCRVKPEDESGETSVVAVLDADTAAFFYERLPVKDVPYEEAFPGVEIEDA